MQVALHVEKQPAECFLQSGVSRCRAAAVYGPHVEEVPPHRLHVDIQRHTFLPVVTIAYATILESPVVVHVHSETPDNQWAEKAVKVEFAIVGVPVRPSGKSAYDFCLLGRSVKGLAPYVVGFLIEVGAPAFRTDKRLGNVH